MLNPIFCDLIKDSFFFLIHFVKTQNDTEMQVRHFNEFVEIAVSTAE